MINKIKAIEKILNKRIITYEFEIILNLYPNKIQSSTELCKLSNSSYSTFYIIIKNMVSEGTLSMCGSEKDKRLRLYKLSDSMIDKLTDVNLNQWIK